MELFESRLDASMSPAGGDGQRGQILGEDALAGTIEVGKRADFILLAPIR